MKKKHLLPHAIASVGVVFALFCACPSLSQAAETISYTYDGAGRLTGMSGQNRAISYIYSSGGDVKAVEVVTNVPPSYIASRTTDSFSFIARAGGSQVRTAGGLRLSTAAPQARSISWQATPGVKYRVQFKDRLEQETWVDLNGDVTAERADTSKTDPSPNADSRFYRVIIVR